MYSLILLSYLAVLAPVLAAPGTQYLYATSTLAPTNTNVISYPTPTSTSVSTTPPLPPNIGELKRREPAVPAVFGKRQNSCSYGTFACSDGSGCCKNGQLCYGNGYCYDPYGSLDGQISSLLAEYSATTDYDQASLQSFLDAMSSTGSTAYQTGTNSNSNYNDNTINVGSGGKGALGTPKKKSNIGMIVGIVIVVIVLAIVAIVVFFFVRRNKQRKEAAQQPFVSQNPQPPINTTTPGPYPPTPGPYPQTPEPYPPPTYPPTPGPYPPTPAPYPPAPKPYIPYENYGGVGDKDKVPYYNNQSVPPNTVEMPANQTPIGSVGQHYQPPPLPAGIVEAGGESVYRPPSTIGHPPGQPPPNHGGAVYEMDSRHYGQQ